MDRLLRRHAKRNRRRRGSPRDEAAPFATALRTMRSSLAIFRDASAVLPLRKTEMRQSHHGGSASPKTMLRIAEDADIRRTSRMPTRRGQHVSPWLFCAMIPLSYRSPKTEVRESKIHGRGLFATADIAKNEIVAIKGDHIVDRKTLREKITPRLGPVEIQIDNDLFIAPVSEEERELSMLYSNHSCDPNLGMRGEITFVAMPEILRRRRAHARLGDDRCRRLFHRMLLWRA